MNSIHKNFSGRNMTIPPISSVTTPLKNTNCDNNQQKKEMLSGTKAPQRPLFVTIKSPPGKIGIVIDKPGDGPPIVTAVKESSIIANQIKVGDRLITVDNEDVRTMKIIAISKLINGKCNNPSRILTVERQRQQQPQQEREERQEQQRQKQITLACENRTTSFSKNITKKSFTSFDKTDRNKNESQQVEVIKVFAPAGKLGLVIDKPDEGPPVISYVKVSSIIYHKIKVGDRILAVDKDDARTMSVIKISTLINDRCCNPIRQFTIFRPRLFEI